MGNPFQHPRPEIPIVGQPFSLEGWFLQIILLCRCDTPKPVLIVGQPGAALGQCGNCRRKYLLQALAIDPAGKPNFQIAMMADTKTDDEIARALAPSGAPA